MTAPNDICTAFPADVILAFAERYPQALLDFTLTNQHANLVEEGFDVALRAAARLADSSLVARKLGELSLRLYASPCYLSKPGAPTSLEDLERHQCVVFRATELARMWALRGASRAGEPTHVSVRGQIGGDDLGFVRAMVVAGGGIGILPQINCAADVASGRLVRVLPGFHPRGATLYVVYPSMKQVPGRFRTGRAGASAGLAPATRRNA